MSIFIGLFWCFYILLLVFVSFLSLRYHWAEDDSGRTWEVCGERHGRNWKSPALLWAGKWSRTDARRMRFVYVRVSADFNHSPHSKAENRELASEAQIRSAEDGVTLTISPCRWLVWSLMELQHSRNFKQKRPAPFVAAKAPGGLNCIAFQLESDELSDLRYLSWNTRNKLMKFSLATLHETDLVISAQLRLKNHGFS